MATHNEILALLPRRLQTRLESLPGYIESLIHEVEEGQEFSRHLSREEIRQVQLVVLIYAIHQLFTEGSRAATIAVECLHGLGLAGFRVGSTVFEGDNVNVRRGRELAEHLRESIQDRRIAAIFTESQSIRQTVLRVGREVLNAGNMD